MTVSIDVRSRRITLSARLQVECKVCRGRAMNVGMCGYQESIMKHIEGNMRDTNDMNFNTDEFAEDAENGEQSSSTQKLFDTERCHQLKSYQSRMKQSVFTYVAEIIRIDELLRNVKTFIDTTTGWAKSYGSILNLNYLQTTTAIFLHFVSRLS